MTCAKCARPIVRDMAGAPDPSALCWYHVPLGPDRHLRDIAPLGDAPDWRTAAGRVPGGDPNRAPLIFGRTWQQIDAMQRRS